MLSNSKLPFEERLFYISRDYLPRIQMIRLMTPIDLFL